MGQKRIEINKRKKAKVKIFRLKVVIYHFVLLDRSIESIFLIRKKGSITLSGEMVLNSFTLFHLFSVCNNHLIRDTLPM